ncbi:Suf-domain-containing protein, partial [Backusella circina FSU 941]
GIKSARALFSRARKASNRTFHVFAASALMEYHNSKDATIAGKVFSLGQKIFADDPDFVCQYLDFLIQMNDDNNTRALFERTLATMPADKSAPVWEKFLDYENKYGDLASVQNVEKRRIEAINTSSAMESFLKRHSYLDIHNIEEQELGSKAREQIAAEASTSTNPEQTIPPNIVATERSAAREPVKRPLLEPVHPERYPRPDFSQWQPFKPSADANRRAPGPSNPPNPIPPPMQPAAPDVKPTNPPEPMMPTVSPMMNNPPVVPPAPPTVVAAPPPIGWNKGPTLPEAVAYFVNNLPPAQTFNGPLIQPGELVDLLRNIIIPVPPQGAAPPPPRPMQQQQQQQQQKSNVHPSRDTRGNFPNRGRGGFKSRGNMPMRGGKNGKRRARDDYEDDYQPHRGMGPNRPPDYDVFRERQVKRHRDDPPY